MFCCALCGVALRAAAPRGGPQSNTAGGGWGSILG